MPAAEPDSGASGIDPVERAARMQKAVQHVEELDQEAWRAITEEADFALAIATMSEAAELARSEFGGGHWLTTVKSSQAAGMKSLAELSPARKQLFLEASKAQSRGAYIWSQGNRERALSQLRLARDKRTEALGPEHILSAYFLLGVAFHENAMKEYAEAKHHMTEAARVLKTSWGERNPGWAHVLCFQAVAEAGLQELEPAERHLREAIQVLEPVAREGFSDFYLMMFADAQLHLARLLNDQDRFGDAEPFARRGSELLAFAPRNAFGKYLESELEAARSVSGQGKNTEAEILFALLLKSLPATPPPEMTASILARYAAHLRRVHRDGEASQLEARVLKLSAQSPSLKSSGDPGSE